MNNEKFDDEKMEYEREEAERYKAQLMLRDWSEACRDNWTIDGDQYEGFKAYWNGDAQTDWFETEQEAIAAAVRIWKGGK